MNKRKGILERRRMTHAGRVELIFGLFGQTSGHYCYRIIRNHEGMIEVSSKKGKGTTFKIYLRASDREAVREKEEA